MNIIISERYTISWAIFSYLNVIRVFDGLKARLFLTFSTEIQFIVYVLGAKEHTTSMGFCRAVALGLNIADSTHE